MALATAIPAFAEENSLILVNNGRSIIAVPGFRTYVATGYVLSEKNLEAIRGLSSKTTPLKLITFDAKQNNNNVLMFRGSFPVYGPNKTPFASLLEAAIDMELVASGAAPPDAPRINATLDEFDFSSFGTGKWTISATFSAEGKAPLTVKNEYSYPISARAVTACADVTNALVGGIEAFLSKVYADPRFKEIIE